MYKVELYVRVRRACMVEGMSTREAARVFGLHRDTVRKMLEYSVPPGYRRQSPPRRPKLDPYHGVIDRILEEDRRLPRKQRHTAKRIYERLRAEHGFGGKYTIVKDYVRERRRRTREMYVPLSHPPGDAQCDFGQAKAVIGGVEQTRPSTTSCWTFPTATHASSKRTPQRPPRRSATVTSRRSRSWVGCPGASSTTTRDWRWTEIFGSERLTGALLDRLTHRVHILEMNGESYRLKQSRLAATTRSADDSPDA